MNFSVTDITVISAAKAFQTQTLRKIGSSEAAIIGFTASPVLQWLIQSRVTTIMMFTIWS